jgi:hypothetical protein
MSYEQKMTKYWNNMFCAGNKSEIFQFEKNWVEMFSAYMQEAN